MLTSWNDLLNSLRPFLGSFALSAGRIFIWPNTDFHSKKRSSNKNTGGNFDHLTVSTENSSLARFGQRQKCDHREMQSFLQGRKYRGRAQNAVFDENLERLPIELVFVLDDRGNTIYGNVDNSFPCSLHRAVSGERRETSAAEAIARLR